MEPGTVRLSNFTDRSQVVDDTEVRGATRCDHGEHTVPIADGRFDLVAVHFPCWVDWYRDDLNIHHACGRLQARVCFRAAHE